MKSETLCIVGCGKLKIWDKYPDMGPVKARDMYTGIFTKRCIEYAEKFYPNSWRVLSAKYGLMKGCDIIQSPYSECFHNSNGISLNQLKNQVKNEDEFQEIVVLGGKFYTELIKSIFPTKNVYNRLEGIKGIGNMIRELNNLLKIDIIVKIRR